MPITASRSCCFELSHAFSESPPYLHKIPQCEDEGFVCLEFFGRVAGRGYLFAAKRKGVTNILLGKVRNVDIFV
jgi:hypothetical protein